MGKFIRIGSLLLLVGLTACQDEEVRTYEVSKKPPTDWPTASSPAQTEATAPRPSTPPAAPMMQSGGNMQALPGMAEQSAQFEAPQWQAPEGWQPQPLGSMRKGSWKIEQDGMTADVSVLAFPGDVGGDLANINRWAGQVGAEPFSPEQLVTLKKQNTISVNSHPALMVNLTGKNGQSIMGVILPFHGATWFFKMQGDTELIKAQAVNFDMFISSVHFHDH